MGNNTSHQSAASFLGPSSRLPSNAIIPVKKRVFAVTVPPDKKNGDTLKVIVDKKEFSIVIPSIAETKLGRPIQPGEKFDAKIYTNLDQGFVSTLPFQLYGHA
jgi:hypothetical protein